MRSAQSTLSVDVLPDGEAPGTVCLRLAGELDITSYPLLQTVTDQVLAARRLPRVSLLVLDMSGVSFADAAGLSPILHARAVLQARGGDLELRHTRRAVMRVLRVLSLQHLAAAG